MSKYRDRVRALREQGLGAGEASEVAFGEKLLRDLARATTFRALRPVLADIIIHQFRVGRAPDKMFQRLETDLSSDGSRTLDERISKLEEDTNPHRLAGHD